MGAVEGPLGSTPTLPTASGLDVGAAVGVAVGAISAAEGEAVVRAAVGVAVGVGAGEWVGAAEANKGSRVGMDVAAVASGGEGREEDG